MKTFGLLAFSTSVLLSCTLAAPFNKRDLVVVTITSNVVETVDVTTTIYVGADATSNVDAAAVSTTSTSVSTSNTPTTSSTLSASSTSTPMTSSTLTTSSTTPAAYVAPTTPTTTPAAYVAPTTPTTTPTPSSTSAPAAAYTPTTSSSLPASTSSSPVTGQSVGACSTDGKCSSSGTPCCGDVTHYDTESASGAKGACGWVNDGKVEDVIALPHGMMGLQSNGNPFCGRTVMVSMGGKEVPAKVVDKCMGCEGQSIDLSDHMFGQLGNPDIGRMKAQWWFTS